MNTFTHVIEIAALVLLFSSVIAVAIGTFLEDNSECDELPTFEQCRHVRVIREDVDA